VSQVESIELPGEVAASGPLGDRFRKLVEELNRRFRRLRDVVNTNEGAPVFWDEAALPTASEAFRGRFLYWDRGQGTEPDSVYVCTWNGTALVWRQVVLDT
jgi:hypothetical protein